LLTGNGVFVRPFWLKPAIFAYLPIHVFTADHVLFICSNEAV